MSDLPSSVKSFYEPVGDGSFRSTQATVGPWSVGLQHGSPPIALLGRELERSGGAARPGMRVTRLSVEFLGAVPVTDVTVKAELLRPGQRVELWAATLDAGGRAALRATSWKLLAEPGRSVKAGATDMPPPIPSLPTTEFFEGVDWVGYGRALEWRFVSGSFRELGPAVVWARSRLPIVPKEALTPLQRVLLMLDSANGVSAELSPRTWSFVPVDLNVILYRYPRGEWVGMDARTVIGDEGIGMTSARIFDELGNLGRSVHTLFVTPR